MKPEDLMTRYPAERKRIVAAAARLVGPDEAEDVANETLLRALAAVDGFRGEAALSTWLHRIAINLAYDHLRSWRRPSIVALDADAVLLEAEADDADPIEQRQMSACVQEVLATLPPAQRQLLVQADVLDQTAPQIAQADGITTGNAKIRLHRARRALQTALENRCDFHHCTTGALHCTPKAD